MPSSVTKRSFDQYSNLFPPTSAGSSYKRVSARANRCPLFVTTTFLLVGVLAGFRMFDFREWFQRTQTSSSSHGHSRRVSSRNQEDSPEASSANIFAVRLFAHAATSQQDVLLSPISIVSALSLAALGATSNSRTEKEFKDVLPNPIPNLNNIDKDDIVLSVATSAWVASDVLPEFRKDAKKAGAEVRGVPKSADEINDWVATVTRGRIKSIMSDLPEQLAGLIINAVFFRASWTTAFNKSETTPMSFSGLEEHVPMMCIEKQHFRFAIIRTDSFSAKIVELPYGRNEAFSAVVLVPEGQASLDNIVSFLHDNPSTWSKWVSLMRSHELDLLALPRFKLEYGVQSVKSFLNDFGLQAAFQANQDDPPFARLTDDPTVYLDDVLHKATIECTEEGTVASAATVVTAVMLSYTEPLHIVADRPFLFAIRERESGLLLFMGRIDKPKSP